MNQSAKEVEVKRGILYRNYMRDLGLISSVDAQIEHRILIANVHRENRLIGSLR